MLHGPIQSGKTSLLMKHLEEKPNVGGFASPIVEGIRFFYLFSEKKYLEMEAGETETDILSIGRYRFRKSGFELAAHQFELDLRAPDINLMILDEIGPLEVRGQGFADLISTLISSKNIPNVIIVVRESLVDYFQTYFRKQGKQTITIEKEELAHLINSGTIGQKE